jgi:ADP-heptose:LPS heptosyltransferase
MIIGMTPGSGRSSPNWSPDRYFEFARALTRRHNATIVVSGTETEQHLLGAFRDAGSSDIVLLPVMPLRKFIGVMSRYDYFFSSSTGPMHIAAALKVPTVSLFCPLPACSPQLWGPSGNTHEVVVAPDTVCQVTCEKDPHLCTMHDVPVSAALSLFEVLKHRIESER